MNEYERQLLELRSECCNTPPVFEISEHQGEIIYEPWCYCRTCLKETSLYNVEHLALQKRLKEINLSEKKLNGIIRRKIKELHSEAISLTDDEDSEISSVCECGKGQSSCNK